VSFALGLLTGVVACALAYALPQIYLWWRERDRFDEHARIQRERFARGSKWPSK
jgi:hypothetical protein